jgi:hypothetical protein
MNALHIGIGAQNRASFFCTEGARHTRRSTCFGLRLTALRSALGGTKNVLARSGDHRIDVRGYRVSNRVYGCENTEVVRSGPDPRGGCHRGTYAEGKIAITRLGQNETGPP